MEYGGEGEGEGEAGAGEAEVSVYRLSPSGTGQNPLENTLLTRKNSPERFFLAADAILESIEMDCHPGYVKMTVPFYEFDPKLPRQSSSQEEVTFFLKKLDACFLLQLFIDCQMRSSVKGIPEIPGYRSLPSRVYTLRQILGDALEIEVLAKLYFEVVIPSLVGSRMVEDTVFDEDGMTFFEYSVFRGPRVKLVMPSRQPHADHRYPSDMELLLLRVEEWINRDLRSKGQRVDSGILGFRMDPGCHVEKSFPGPGRSISAVSQLRLEFSAPGVLNSGERAGSQTDLQSFFAEVRGPAVICPSFPQNLPILPNGEPAPHVFGVLNELLIDRESGICTVSVDWTAPVTGFGEIQFTCDLREGEDSDG